MLESLNLIIKITSFNVTNQASILVEYVTLEDRVIFVKILCS
jgi:hypothetical protein